MENSLLKDPETDPDSMCILILVRWHMPADMCFPWSMCRCRSPSISSPMLLWPFFPRKKMLLYSLTWHTSPFWWMIGELCITEYTDAFGVSQSTLIDSNSQHWKLYLIWFACKLWLSLRHLAVHSAPPTFNCHNSQSASAVTAVWSKEEGWKCSLHLPRNHNQLPLPENRTMSSGK